jgi:hypothetical protein
VGNGCIYSAGCFKLVGCVSQRLVLAESRSLVSAIYFVARFAPLTPFTLN